MQEEVLKSNTNIKQIVIVMGDISVGKTTALRRLAHRPVVGKIVPTVAIQFYAAQIPLYHKTFRLHFWDTSGQRSYWPVGLSHLQQADAVVVMYDLTSFGTLHTATQIIDMIYKRRKVPLLLFGNKLDLCAKGEGREVTSEVANAMQGVQGVTAQGSGFIDQSFQKGLEILLKQYFCQGIAFQSEEAHSGCCF